MVLVVVTNHFVNRLYFFPRARVFLRLGYFWSILCCFVNEEFSFDSYKDIVKIRGNCRYLKIIYMCGCFGFLFLIILGYLKKFFVHPVSRRKICQPNLIHPFLLRRTYKFDKASLGSKIFFTF